jgi:hypothetical protein
MVAPEPASVQSPPACTKHADEYTETMWRPQCLVSLSYTILSNEESIRGVLRPILMQSAPAWTTFGCDHIEMSTEGTSASSFHERNDPV